MPDILLKRWSDWSAGVGYPIDEGANGMHTASRLLGLRGELRPAPEAKEIATNLTAGRQYQYFFEEPKTAKISPTLDASSYATVTNPSSSPVLSWSHTVADLDSRILVVKLFNEGAQVGVTGILFGDQGLTFLENTTVSGGDGLLSIYYLINPHVGTETIEVYLTKSGDFVLGIGESWYGVDQTSPFGPQAEASANDDGGPATVNAASASDEIVIDAVCSMETVKTLTVGANQTQMKNVTIGDGRLASSYETGASTTTMSWACGAATDWGIIAVPLIGLAAGIGPPYLYAEYGRKAGSSTPVRVIKFSLSYDDFANLETGFHSLSPLTVPGQPVRYQGYWWFPMGDNQKARRLQVVGSGAIANDTLDATATALGADHFTNLGSQVAASLKHSGNDAGGMRILKEDGDIGTEADWGPAFQVGDKLERAAGLRSLAGLSFVLNVEGLYSFDKNARARLVFEDFRAWRHVFDNISIVPWHGGLALSHPTGLLFWEPGKLPVNIGLNADVGGSAIPPAGPPTLRGGRYHGLAPAGRFLYAIYQPDISSTAVNVMVGYPREGSPYDLIWQQLTTSALQDTDHMLGCFVSVSSKPVSAEYVTPTLWYGNGPQLRYKVLSTAGSPFRSRADTHVVEAAGDAYMSELMFERPTDMSEMVVYTQNMVAGDEWQLKFLADGEEETNLGPPIKRNGRHVIKVDRHDVYRLMLHVNWATTVTTARVAPSIQRVELYGPG